MLSNAPYFFYLFYRTLYTLKVPLLPKVFAIVNRIIFGAYIPPSCRLGKNVKFGYGGCGVVIHARAVIGNNCHVGPNVTVGGRSKQFNVPVIGNNVYIAGGAKILGNVKVGDNAIIGANAVVIKDVKSNSIVGGIPAKTIRSNINPSDHI